MVPNYHSHPNYIGIHLQLTSNCRDAIDLNFAKSIIFYLHSIKSTLHYIPTTKYLESAARPESYKMLTSDTSKDNLKRV